MCGSMVRTTPASERRISGGMAVASAWMGFNTVCSFSHSSSALGPPNRSIMGSKLPLPTLNLKLPSGMCITHPSYLAYWMLSPCPTSSSTSLRGL
eukprot:CAMPEP_0173181820 /NCGR_PEP_ID=MMETSP1141-20130122/7495_1 /TAXON_ID=483371 /ORGANISM="non described non described, Strain CCMP2298" /LENGTH=94 /DNA_ID=CAMNT_0014104847 /DNA_START=1160 /DNA_END=1444 /DNA_ORIENTATION=+